MTFRWTAITSLHELINEVPIPLRIYAFMCYPASVC